MVGYHAFSRKRRFPPISLPSLTVGLQQAIYTTDTMISVTHQWSCGRHGPSPPPRGEWPALTSVTHRDDAVGLYWISEACFWYKSSKATCDLYDLYAGQ